MTVQIVHYVSKGGSHSFLIQSKETDLYFSQAGQLDQQKPADAWKFRYHQDARTQSLINGWQIDENFNNEFPMYIETDR